MTVAHEPASTCHSRAPVAVTHEPAQMHVVASPDRTRLAVVEPRRVLVYAVPDLAAIAEIGLDDATEHDVAFAGSRLVVMSRSRARTIMHVVDTAGPTKLAEVMFRSPTRIAAIAGEHVLASGTVASLVDVARPEPIAVTLPLRSKVIAAGALGDGRLMVAATGGPLEEWCAITRRPLRRLRLDRPLEPAFLGGTRERVWLIPRDAARVDIIALTTRSTRDVILAEPPLRAVANRTGDLLAVVGAETGTTYIVDLARRAQPIRLDRGPVADVAWTGDHTLALLSLGGALELLTLPGAAVIAEPPGSVACDEPEDISPTKGSAHSPLDRAQRSGPATQSLQRWTREEISTRLAAWKERVAGGTPAADADVDARGLADACPRTTGVCAGIERLDAARVDPDESVFARARSEHAAVAPAHPGGWRVAIAAWARSICARSYRAAPTDRGPLDDIIARHHLAPELRDAIVLLYGAHLGGATAAPLDVAAVIGWRWRDTNRSGRLAQSGLVRVRSSQLLLTRTILDELDAAA